MLNTPTANDALGQCGPITVRWHLNIIYTYARISDKFIHFGRKRSTKAREAILDKYGENIKDSDRKTA
jgi:hypothetical protein